jgi:hypothetical protein
MRQTLRVAVQQHCDGDAIANVQRFVVVDMRRR